MSEVTFSPEQVREIRRRIEDAYSHKQDILAAFPLPTVVRYRTFQWGGYAHRVRGSVVEFESINGAWVLSGYGTGSVASFAEHMARYRDWTTLAALADVAACPVEEVDA